MSSMSVWWPTPFHVSRWFDAESIEASQRYHRPLHRAAIVRVVARVALVGLAQLLVINWSAQGDRWIDWVVGAIAIAGCWWLPAAAVDAWFEYRHEPRFGHDSLPKRQFVVGSILVLGASVAVALLASIIVRLSIEWFGARWWFVVGAATMAALVVVGSVGAALSRAGQQIEPLEDAEIFRSIGEELGLDVTFARMRSESIAGLNALTIGWRRVDVVVTEDLLAEADELQQHVVAHELSHVRHRDTVTSMMTTALTEGLGIGLLAFALPLDFASDGRRFPLLVLMAAAVVAIARIPLAWLSRAHERRADIEAHRLSGPTPEWALRRLHLTDRADLCPPWWVRLVSTHPSPGERLELAPTHVQRAPE